MNGLTIVTIQRLDGCDTGRPILDVPTGIGREQVIAIVRPRHAAKGRVVGTHDEFKAEINAIPKRKFSFLIAREQSTAPGRPTDAHDGGGILGSRRVGEPGKVKRRDSGPGNSGNWHAHEPQLRRMRLQISLGLSHLMRDATFCVKTRIQIQHGGDVKVDGFANQIAFRGLLFFVIIVAIADIGDFVTVAHDYLLV